MELFNIEKTLEGLGFTTQDKSEEYLSTKDNLCVYYYQQTYISPNGNCIGMTILRLGGVDNQYESDILYKGILPTDKITFCNLLQMIEPSFEYLKKVDDLYNDALFESAGGEQMFSK